MDCRRCLKKIANTDLDNDNFNDDDEIHEVVTASKTDVETVEGYVTKIAHDHPTMLCLNCFDEYYLNFCNLMVKDSKLRIQIDTIENSPEADPKELQRKLKKLSRQEIEFNIEVINWIRKGL